MSKVDWKKIVGSVAPALATALGGPLAGVAIKTIANQVLGKPDATEQEVEAAMLDASPQDLIKLRQVDNEFRALLVNAGIKLEEISAADRANAREREVKTGDSWTPRIIAAAVVLGWFVIQWYLLTHLVPAEMRDIVMRSLGTVDMALGLVLGYYFGSSASSRQKNDIIAAAASK
jgi:hypothetical protein